VPLFKLRLKKPITTGAGERGLADWGCSWAERNF